MIINTHKLALLAWALATLLMACKHEAAAVRQTPAIVGTDRDEHGCIGSAGYSWCARENACRRPWELAQEKQFANSAEAYSNYCATPAGLDRRPNPQP